MRRVALLAAVVLSALLVAPAAGATTPRTVNITDCGVTVPRGFTGIVQNDIASCTAASPDEALFGIALMNNAKLDLNGHTITFPPNAPLMGPVKCEKTCEVHGGTLTGSGTIGGVGIEATPKSRLNLHDLTIANVAVGVEDAIGNLKVTNVTIDATHFGIYVTKKLIADHVNVTLHDAVAGPCLEASQPGGSVRATDSVLTGCGTGIDATVKVTGTRVTITGAQQNGVQSKVVKLTDSSVTGTVVGVDVWSSHKPVLVNTTCGKGGPNDWGVCTND
jgi:hypothetical protein